MYVCVCSQKYIYIYVCTRRHVLVHNNFYFHFFVCATFQDLTRPLASSCSCASCFSSCFWSSAAIEMKSFVCPENVFLSCCCWWVSFIALRPTSSQSWGAHNKTAFQCLDKRSQMASFLHSPHKSWLSNYLYTWMCVKYMQMPMSAFLCVSQLLHCNCVYLSLSFFYSTSYMHFYDVSQIFFCCSRFCHLFLCHELHKKIGFVCGSII